MFNTLISRAREHLAKRRHYNRLAAEIEGLSPRDLADLRADRQEMLQHAYITVFGRR